MKNIGFSFSSEVLKNVSFILERGKSIGILGINGNLTKILQNRIGKNLIIQINLGKT